MIVWLADLSRYDRSNCRWFAEKTVDSTLDRLKAPRPKRIDYIYFGKLGEIVFQRFLEHHGIYRDESQLFDLRRRVPDYDFLTASGERIDVKAAHDPEDKCMLIPVDQLNDPKDYYVGVKIYDEYQGRVWGFDTHDMLRSPSERDFGQGPAYWKELHRLQDINVLLDKM